uniref:PAZ domain-containing protein n=1 Tax=Steinernema glaseri TaxID=37863 RepID=A0A1I7Y442_9BILA
MGVLSFGPGPLRIPIPNPQVSEGGYIEIFKNWRLYKGDKTFFQGPRPTFAMEIYMAHIATLELTPYEFVALLTAVRYLDSPEGVQIPERLVDDVGQNTLPIVFSGNRAVDD